MPRKSAKIRLVRAYDVTEADSGYRVLVDRLWPRGIKKTDLHIDAWLKDLAPSTALRQWFNHQSERWDEFRKRYFKELSRQPDQLQELRTAIRQHSVLLIYGARDFEHNNAVALREFLAET